MGLEDFTDKDRVSGTDENAEAAATAATAGAQDAAADTREGFMDRAKELLSDENVEKLAEKIKSVAPDSVDEMVDKLADKAQKANDRFEP